MRIIGGASTAHAHNMHFLILARNSNEAVVVDPTCAAVPCCHLMVGLQTILASAGRTSQKGHCLRIFVIFEKEMSQSTTLQPVARLLN